MTHRQLFEFHFLSQRKRSMNSHGWSDEETKIDRRCSSNGNIDRLEMSEGKERCGDGGNRPIRIWARLVDVVSVKTWFVWATCIAVRDFSWPQHSSPTPTKQSETSMVIDLSELNDPFHFSKLLGKTIASSSFEDGNAYGTFIDDAGGSSAPTTTSSYPYALGSREPTVIVLGGCPACKVGGPLLTAVSTTLSP